MPGRQSLAITGAIRLAAAGFVLVWAAGSGLMAAGSGSTAAAQTPAGEEMLLGRIEFPTSGSPEAQAQFRLGVLALHSFWYEQARDYFLEAQALDPGLRYGPVGRGHELRQCVPDRTGSVKDMNAWVKAVIARMDELDAAGTLVWSDRERGWAEAVRRRFAPGYGLADRRQDYAQAMEQLSLRYPGDDEATVFAALSLMALPGFDREQPLHVVTVAGRLEEVYERESGAPRRGALPHPRLRYPDLRRHGACARRASTRESRRPHRTRCTCRAIFSVTWGCGPKLRLPTRIPGRLP